MWEISRSVLTINAQYRYNALMQRAELAGQGSGVSDFGRGSQGSWRIAATALGPGRTSPAEFIRLTAMRRPVSACGPIGTSSRTRACSTLRTRSCTRLPGHRVGVAAPCRGRCGAATRQPHRLESRGPGHLAVSPCHPAHVREGARAVQAGGKHRRRSQRGAAVDWTRECRLGGLRLERRSGARSPRGPRRRVRGDTQERTEPIRALRHSPLSATTTATSPSRCAAPPRRSS